MIRKTSLLTIIFISMFFIPLPLYAFEGVGHNGWGGRGSFGGRGFSGHRFGGHSSFSGGFSGYSNPINRGFTRGGSNTGYFVQRHVSNPNHQALFNQRYSGSSNPNRFGHEHFDRFGHEHFDDFDHHEHEHSFSNFVIGFDFGALAAFPFVAYPYYAYPYYGYPYYSYPYDYPYAGSYPPDYGDPYASSPPSDQPSEGLDVQVTPDDQSYGDLEIQVTPENVEVYVDGKFIGLSDDFNGSTTVSVTSGTHVVEFRYNGSSTSTNVTIAPGSKSVIREEFNNDSKNPA